MASEYCLTCGHTKNSHVFVEEQHVLKDGEKSTTISLFHYVSNWGFLLITRLDLEISIKQFLREI